MDFKVKLSQQAVDDMDNIISGEKWSERMISTVFTEGRKRAVFHVRMVERKVRK